MKHIDPTPHASAPAPRPSKAARRTSGIALILAGLVLVAGLGFGMSHFGGPPARDEVSDAQKQALEQNFLKLAPVQLTPVADAELDQALASMKLPPDQARALKQQLLGAPTVQPGHQAMQLAWLEVWDARAEDGDVVHVSAAGYEVDVPMLHARTRIAVPVDASKSVVLTGVTDGGGGITLGVLTSMGVEQLPVLAPGASLTLPVAL